MGNSIYGLLSRYFPRCQLGRNLRDDLPTDTDRLLFGVVELSVGGVNDFSVNLICPSTIVSEDTRRTHNVTLGFTDTLSVIESFDRSQQKQVLLEKIRKVV